MKRFWQGLVAFGAEREHGASLALTRIAPGVTLFCHLTHLLVKGAAQFAWTGNEWGGMSGRPGPIEYIGGNTPGIVLTLAIGVAIGALFIAFGLFTRTSLILTWVTFRALLETNAEARSGYDSLMVNIMFILILSSCGRAYSLDARLFGKDAVVSRWPRMLLVMQIGMLYGGSALMKGSNGWVPGGDADALWFILHQPMWSRLESLPTWSFFIFQVATTSTWLWELAGPLFALSVWLRESNPTSRFWSRIKRFLDRVRFRELWLIAGVSIHIGIELTMEVGVFTPVSLSLYFCAVRPDEWRDLLARVRARVFRSP